MNKNDRALLYLLVGVVGFVLLVFVPPATTWEAEYGLCSGAFWLALFVVIAVMQFFRREKIKNEQKKVVFGHPKK